MTEARKSGQIDLEKELNCSICTEILFQPLTLLDCLHTFCGACLKEWFAFQASTAKSLHPYTCPSCRASVRGTRPNATVTTLLDMFLQANPAKQRTEDDKLEQRARFKPGDNVLPKLRLRRAPGEEEDQRVLDSVVALSLNEAGIATASSGNSLAPDDRRTRERSRGSRSRDSSRGTPRSRNEASQPSSRRGGHRSSQNPSRDPSPRARARHIEHQSSLRSLMSASELDPQEMQEEILRQIAEEGLLDGIDLENMDPSQEEELSERIAQRYQQRREETLRSRRQRDRGTSANPPSFTNPSASSTQVSREDPNTRRVERPPIPASAASAPPPISNPHLMSSANQGQPRQRRSSQSSAQSASHVENASNPAPVIRSSSEVTRSSPTSTRPERTRRMSHERSTTDPDRVRGVRSRTQAGSTGSAPGSPHLSDTAAKTTTQSAFRQRSDSNPRPQRSPRNNATFPLDRHTHPASNSSPSLATTTQTLEPPTVGLAISNAPTSDARPTSSSSTNHRPAVYPEPSISCNRCNKSHIEYELHYNCSKCAKGNYNLCLRCYRSGKGCLHWYGFGDAAYRRYELQRPPEGYHPTHDRPHVLSGHRYLKPKRPVVQTPTPDQPNRALTEEDPSKRLEAGVFCDICSNFANACYWKCDTCNEGAWGFCNTCVNQGKHCTHPLLPLKEKLQTLSSSKTNLELTPPPTIPSPPTTPKAAQVVQTPHTIPLANLSFQPLTFSTECDICKQYIHPSLSRFHCPKCEQGDYDICTNCYLHLVSTGRITIDNGHQGWRRCLQGHRMCIVGFEDRDGGQRRIVVAEIVGGWALKESPPPSSSPPTENMATPTPPNWSWKDEDGTMRKATVRPHHLPTQILPGRFPPNGGVGLRCQANWSYFPDEGVRDELMFPKGAEVREGEDINGDWFWGVYAGGKGLFPGNYCVILGNGR